MALSQRRSSLLDAVGGRRPTLRTASTKATSRTSPARTAIPVKPPVVKLTATTTAASKASASRIPVTRPAAAARKQPLEVPSPLSDLSWKFDSRSASPDVNRPPARPPIRPKSASLRKSSCPAASPRPPRSPRSPRSPRREVIIQSRKDAAGAAGDAAVAGVTPQGPGGQAPPDRGEPPAVVERPPQSEEQAIHDLQELVRRQQEELEQYQHPDEKTGDTAAEPQWPLSCALVQQVSKDAKADANVVVVDEPYSGPLQVKTIRLEDQDTSHDVLQDPRLAATRSRLNQRLQHLLDEVGEAAGKDLTRQDDEGAAREADQEDVSCLDPEDDDVGDVVGDLLGSMESPTTELAKPAASDPRRRSVYLTEASAAALTLPDDTADWEPQELTDRGPDGHDRWPGADVGAGRPPRDTLRPMHFTRTVPDWGDARAAEPGGPSAAVGRWEDAADAADVDAAPTPSHKDQYHQEIRQLLQKLNTDEAVFPYGQPEPIYATANKNRGAQSVQTAGLHHHHCGAAGDEEEGEDDGEEDGYDPAGGGGGGIILSPVKQKAGGPRVGQGQAGRAVHPPPVRPQQAAGGDLDKMSPLSDDAGLTPGSDLSLGSSSSSDNTSADDGIGDERPPPSRPWSGARSRGRREAADTRAASVRDLSMDSGIQGSSCDLDAADSSASASSSSASDRHEDEADAADAVTEALRFYGTLH